MNKDALVSIITPSYNAAEFIEETIKSVLNQSYKSIEYIIVDDGSTDDTLAIINKYGDSLKVVSSQHKGACTARNIGAEIASGDYFLFLDADDIIENNTIEVFLNKIIHLDNTLIGCNWKRLNLNKNEWEILDSGLNSFPKNNDFVHGWLSGWYIVPAGIFWTKSIFKRIGGWDESLAANQDGDLILRALIDGVKINLTNETTVYYRHHNSDRVSISSTKSVRNLDSRMRVLEKVVNLLKDKDSLENYKIDIGQLYHKLARNNFSVDKNLARICNDRAKKYAGNQRFIGSKIHVLLTKIFGLETKEFLANFLSNIGMSKSMRKKSKTLKELSKNG